MSDLDSLLYPLSSQAASIWGKSDYGKNQEWLPLVLHMSDSLEVAGKLWDCWLPQGTRDIVSRGVCGDQQLAKKLYLFLAGVHDIGKATPNFQVQTWGFPSGDDSGLAWKPEQAGLRIRAELRGQSHLSHPIAGQVILNSYLGQTFQWESALADSYSCVVGGHHGKPPVASKVKEAAEARLPELGWDQQAEGKWSQVQNELIRFVQERSGMGSAEFAALGHTMLPPMAESILTGLVIMADWIASNTDFFPLLALYPEEGEERIIANGQVRLDMLKQRVECGWDELNITPSWRQSKQYNILAASPDDVYGRRFDLPPTATVRPVQAAAVRIAQEVPDPGLMIIEAPMGEGKTEAALVAAEVLATRTSRGGVCLALPTMATTDAMFARVHSWLRHVSQDCSDERESLYLAHGKAQLNDEFQGLMGRSGAHGAAGVGIDVDRGGHTSLSMAVDEATIVDEWMRGRKKGVLANFLVCTVDQVLMGALDMKHVALRQLALANKVVLIDECHAYDVYMQQYLLRLLEWLAAFDVPVVLLSATLPQELREQLTQAYVKGRQAELSPPRPYMSAVPQRHRRRRKPVESANGEGVTQEDRGHKQMKQGSQAYPLITYTSGQQVGQEDVPASGRKSEVETYCMGDDDSSLLTLLQDVLVEGGCVGLICNTVGRAQHAAEVLTDAFGSDVVTLTHSRFIDVDRMSNETVLRSQLGPDATATNCQRPKKAIVVGTQVLEQSLDIDFDLLITDVAPTDLVMQRLGRVHRHQRGVEECDRPRQLRKVRCYIRGIESWSDTGPVFARGIESVYFRATLLEFLAVSGLTMENASAHFRLPYDIASCVRKAYSSEIVEDIPQAWMEDYKTAGDKRAAEMCSKISRAECHLLHSVSDMCQQGQTLVNWFAQPLEITGKDEDKGQRAVRDTQESVEVILLANAEDGQARLLPWVGSDAYHIQPGELVETQSVPSIELAKLVAECTVRLPLIMGQGLALDKLIEELEDHCGDRTAAWQKSDWLSGQLVLFLDQESQHVWSTEIHGYKLSYSQDTGLLAERLAE
ncbi:CRISPR-associated helicase/endonuclease Cas3 [Bombiscardovia nodaiensis]|uniref:CRISPR-associated helicase/endonuclease Cas3 n=1 Tax=Bombiscardovia nodaiensis TaxID=2932181 RepID=A0ABN6SA77_9BIFI|nr:CRISPR-associated helicase/endonuclease Cas3 [Bombiscardovia nodaiensis]